jgi:hypothetical protein
MGRSRKAQVHFLATALMLFVCGVGAFPSRSIDDAEQFPEFVFPDNSFGFDLVNNPLLRSGLRVLDVHG